MPKYGACNLGSINLSQFVNNPYSDTAYFDATEFSRCVKVAIRALDEVLDENLSNHPLPEQREMAYNYRNVGLGVMGLHDMLIKLGKKYGSKDSIEFVDSMMELMFKSAVIASSELAKEKGTFPKYSPSVLKSKIIRNHFTEDDLTILGINQNGLRNCSLLSIAPTGSLGTMFNVSTGCEPIFAMSYTRKTESLNNNTDKYYTVYTGVTKDYIEGYGKDLPSYFIESKDIHWVDRINMQAALQNHIDTAISSTINLPNNISLPDMEALYLYAWEQGLKGVTIFRDGCKRTGILTTDTSDKSEKKENNGQEKCNVLPRGYILEVDNNTVGKERHLITGCGTLHHCSYFDPTTGELLENYINKGSQGGCFSNLIGLSRMISLAARLGGDVREIADQLLSVPACPSYVSRKVTKHDTSKGACCPNAIGYALLDMCNEMKEDIGVTEDESAQEIEEDISEKDITDTDLSKYKCPECGSDLVHEGGCVSCKICGWSKCG